MKFWVEFSAQKHEANVLCINDVGSTAPTIAVSDIHEERDRNTRYILLSVAIYRSAKIAVML